MKHIKLVLAVAAAMTTMLSLGTGSAGADACFDDAARAGVRPGVTISDVARGAAQGIQPGSGTDELAREVGIINQVRNDVCPQ
ncbi:MAG: hypothetical protein LC781_17320 [Actinobacteria bacterium]|nr:hypothetical protein [Actinomycetota bacterium]